MDTTGVRRFSICLVGTMLAALVASAQPPNGGGPGPVLGIVEIPEMFVIDPNKGRYAPIAALTLYRRPDSESKVLALISSAEAIDSAEYGHEEAGALVYGRQRGYFLIRTSRGAGWIRPHSAGAFHSLETLITSDLAYLTTAWDGFVSQSPGSADRTRVGPHGKQESVRVKRLRTLNGKLWVEVEVISHTFCESQEPPTIKARGWVRAHDATGAPTVWFRSGGC